MWYWILQWQRECTVYVITLLWWSWFIVNNIKYKYKWHYESGFLQPYGLFRTHMDDPTWIHGFWVPPFPLASRASRAWASLTCSCPESPTWQPLTASPAWMWTKPSTRRRSKSMRRARSPRQPQVSTQGENGRQRRGIWVGEKKRGGMTEDWGRTPIIRYNM